VVDMRDNSRMIASSSGNKLGKRRHSTVFPDETETKFMHRFRGRFEISDDWRLTGIVNLKSLRPIIDMRPSFFISKKNK
jgi:hypothetical protein